MFATVEVTQDAVTRRVTGSGAVEKSCDPDAACDCRACASTAPS
jgi:hypothetical protein